MNRRHLLLIVHVLPTEGTNSPSLIPMVMVSVAVIKVMEATKLRLEMTLLEREVILKNPK